MKEQQNKEIEVKVDISVIVPLYNEDESIGELFSWIDRVMKENHF